MYQNGLSAVSSGRKLVTLWGSSQLAGCSHVFAVSVTYPDSSALSSRANILAVDRGSKSQVVTKNLARPKVHVGGVGVS